MSIEWSRATIINLLNAYKKEDILYNQLSALYHNKQARNASWTRILKAVNKTQNDTTLADLNKKIQSLRTQFGQEIAKVEKSSANSDFVYQPKVWWFKHFLWIGDFMKTRNDATLMSEIIKLTKTTQNEKDDAVPRQIIYYPAVVDADTENVSTEIEFTEEFDSPDPPRKKQKLIKAKGETSKSNDTQSRIETIEYTVIDEDEIGDETITSEKSKSHIIEYQNERNFDRNKRRSKAFGKYVSALLMDIDSNELFFDLQNNITKLIQEAAMKQQNSGKS